MAESPRFHVWWRHGDKTEVWKAAPLVRARNSRAKTTRTRIAAAVRARPPLSFHKRPRNRKHNRTWFGCCCGKETCTALRRNILKKGDVRFDASCVIPKVDTAKIPNDPDWIGSPVVSPSATKGRELRAKIKRWVNYKHAVAIQTALHTT